MKKHSLILIFVVLFSIGGTAQSFVGSSSSNLNFAQIAPAEFVYYSFSGNTLELLNPDLTVKQTLSIPANGSDTITRINYVSRNLFDQDNGIEYLVTYKDNSTNLVTDIKVIDNGVGNSLPNHGLSSGYNEVASRLYNLGSGSQLILWKYSYNTGSSETSIYDLSGQALMVREIELEQATLAPNPTTNILKIPGVKGELIQIFDINGKEILKETHTGQEHILKVNDLSTGSYVLRSGSATYKFQKK